MEPNPIPVKWALSDMNLIHPGIRLPLTWLSAAAQPRIRSALQAAQPASSPGPGAKRMRHFPGQVLLALTLRARVAGRRRLRLAAPWQAKKQHCPEPALTSDIQNMPPLRVPAGLDAPDTRNAVKIPPLTEPQVARAAGRALPVLAAELRRSAGRVHGTEQSTLKRIIQLARQWRRRADDGRIQGLPEHRMDGRWRNELQPADKVVSRCSWILGTQTSTPRAN